VCIVGGVRALHATWASVWSNAVEALQPDPARRRVVFETTFDTADCNGNPGLSAENKAMCAEQVQQSVAFLNTSQVLEHATRRFDLHVDEDLGKNCSHPFAAEHACCKRHGSSSLSEPPTGVWGLKQYLRRAQCSERLKRIENETGVAFDAVMWIRPDVYVFDAFPSAADLLRSRNARVFATSKEHGSPSFGDAAFIAPRSLAWLWHRVLFEALGSDRCDGRRGRTQLPEVVLQDYARREDVPVQVYPFLLTIARSNVTADCTRMDNAVLRNAAVPAGTTDGEDRMITPYELCERRFPGPNARRPRRPPLLDPV
jgi:hypothetical protein